jgi:hypothetical protein
MALRSIQTLTEMSTRNLPRVKSGRRVGLTTLPPSMNRMSENVGASTLRKPKGLYGLYRDNFTLSLPYEQERKVAVLSSLSNGMHHWTTAPLMTLFWSRALGMALQTYTQSLLKQQW